MLTEKEFIKQLGTLVSFRTLTGDVTTNRQALDYVQGLITPAAKIRRLVNGQAEMLIASNTDTLTPEFGYLVHIDVVAAADALFTMRQEGGRVYGRGVSDMKFSIPLGVALLNEIIAKQAQFSFSLVITTDEETGGYEGAAYLVGEQGWRPQTLIVPDGGDNFRFVEKSKGVAQLVITATGRSAHASRPWEGQNALPALCRLVTKLEEKYGSNGRQPGWQTTLNFGQLQGGISTNQVCDQATLKIDYRYPETDSLARIQAELVELTASIDPTMTIKNASTGLPTFTNVRLPVVQRFLACLTKQLGRKVAVEPNFGASDARHFAPFKTPILMIKPTGGDIHCATEWLDVAATLDFYQALRHFLLEES